MVLPWSRPKHSGKVGGSAGRGGVRSFACWPRGTGARRFCWDLTIFANRTLRRIVAGMKVREMRKLVQLRAVTLDPTVRRLGACYDIFDLRLPAKRRIPRPVFAYGGGGAAGGGGGR